MAEEEIEALKRMMGGLGNSNVKMDSNVDVTKILMQINMLSEEVKKRPDRLELEKVRTACHSYSDKELQTMEVKVTEKSENLRHELERLRAEFEQHKVKDFGDLANRVTALEKRINQIMAQLASMGGPVAQSNGADAGALAELEIRVGNLENGLNEL